MDEYKAAIDCEHCVHNHIREKYATGRIQCDAVRNENIIQIRENSIVCVAFKEVRDGE